MLEATLGQAQHHEDLTIFPILADKERELPYGLLVEALSVGILSIREKDGGTVPTLIAINNGIQPILILDGEQLIGAKQNRMTRTNWCTCRLSLPTITPEGGIGAAMPPLPGPETLARRYRGRARGSGGTR